MPSISKSSTITAVLILLAISIGLPSASVAQTPLLSVKVIDTAASSGSTSIPISVYMNNYEDTVVGYSLWLILNRPDIASFQLAFDTVGTLSSGWEMVQVNHVGGQPFNVKIAAVANWPSPPTTPGISPQQSGLPLIKLLLDVQDIPDTTTERSVEIYVASGNLSEFAFSNPSGQVIGTMQDSAWDTAYYACNQWVGDSCASWEEVYPWDPYDSLVGYWRVFAALDTDRVLISDGSLTITGGYICGNINNSGGMDISDLVYLVDWMFTAGPEPPVIMSADCDGSGAIDISDLVWMVDFMFTGGPPPICGK